MYTNPKRIFGLPDQPETWVDIDLDQEFVINGREQQTKCAWTPFEGRRVYGRVTQVVLRGKVVYRNGIILARPGSGKSIHP
jgi:carbamoyl-phosphate synthase/aspartate carbamoyltransferase/dihydroorotase